MAGTYTVIKTWAAGEILTASDLNDEFQNVVTNMDPDSIGDESASTTEMRALVDPGESGSESLATDLKGELLRLRNVLKEIIGKTYWYQTPSNDIETMDDNLIKGDGTVGRVLRSARLLVDDGSNATTLKCTLTSIWNGDTIAEVDNVAKGATTGTDWTLDADGKILTIEASGLTGNAIAIISISIQRNVTGGRLYAKGSIASNDLVIQVYSTGTGTVDMTTLVDSGLFEMEILYLTSA